MRKSIQINGFVVLIPDLISIKKVDIRKSLFIRIFFNRITGSIMKTIPNLFSKGSFSKEEEDEIDKIYNLKNWDEQKSIIFEGLYKEISFQMTSEENVFGIKDLYEYLSSQTRFPESFSEFEIKITKNKNGLNLFDTGCELLDEGTFHLGTYVNFQESTIYISFQGEASRELYKEVLAIYKEIIDNVIFEKC